MKLKKMIIALRINLFMGRREVTDLRGSGQHIADEVFGATAIALLRS